MKKNSCAISPKARVIMMKKMPVTPLPSAPKTSAIRPVTGTATTIASGTARPRVAEA
ncbi:MAG: hypothetical protein GDA47_02725 [Rhodospirillales bacterium]|nr:hypothetical protein [Rhodospirillales bacterium]